MMKQILGILCLLSINLLSGQVQEVWLQSRMDGTVELEHGLSVSFWGYGYNTPGFPTTRIFLPGPLLRFNLGDSVIIHLKNNSPEDHTIHWHGLDVDQENDGVGHTSNDVHSNEEFTYRFVCTHSGTYMYHCHVLTTLHLAMGMYGMFIVNGESANYLYGPNTKFTKEHTLMFSEMNTAWNSNPISPGPFHLYEANYLMINGLSGNQLLTDEDELVSGTILDTFAFRLANIGYGMTEVIFPDQLEIKVVASDGREIPHFSTDTIVLYPGERYDLLAKPTSNFDQFIKVNYYDQRNENLLGANYVRVLIDDQLGIEENSPSNLTAHPNPFTDEITITVSDLYVDKVVKIYSLSGILVHEELVKISPQTLGIQLNPGMYIMKIDDLSLRIIKQ
jgi:FtsP/CotA-like multicopper oxidase with cupredoxin domain